MPGIKSGAKGCRASTAYDGTVKSGNTSQKFPQYYGRMMSWNINQTRQNCQSISPSYFADANSSPKTHLFVVYSNIYGALKSRCSEQKNAKFPQSCLFARPKNTTCNGPVPQVGGPSYFADANWMLGSFWSLARMLKDLSKIRSDEINASKTSNCGYPAGPGVAPLVPAVSWVAGAAQCGRRGVRSTRITHPAPSQNQAFPSLAQHPSQNPPPRARCWRPVSSGMFL